MPKSARREATTARRAKLHTLLSVFMSFPTMASRAAAWTSPTGSSAVRRRALLSRFGHGRATLSSISGGKVRVMEKESNGRHHEPRSFSSSSKLLLMTTAISGGAASMNATKAEAEINGTDNEHKKGEKIDEMASEVTEFPFDTSTLEYDHYNGVVAHLDTLRNSNNEPLSEAKFSKNLSDALSIWKAEGRRGIWIYAPHSMSGYVPSCVEHGFKFHFVKDDKLVLTRWLPEESASRLPLGPTHQIGVGAVVLHPTDPSLMLVVQEKTGPAAARKLWKMPTGLLDPGEDIPDAAKRELMEETGLSASVDGIICFRQAHSASRSSDLFFVCKMSLPEGDDVVFRAQPEEIAEIRWMKVEEYAAQDLWQKSPVYQSMNDAIFRAAKSEPGSTISSEQLPVGFRNGTNAIFKSSL